MIEFYKSISIVAVDVVMEDMVQVEDAGVRTRVPETLLVDVLVAELARRVNYVDLVFELSREAVVAENYRADHADVLDDLLHLLCEALALPADEVRVLVVRQLVELLVRHRLFDAQGPDLDLLEHILRRRRRDIDEAEVL